MRKILAVMLILGLASVARAYEPFEPIGYPSFWGLTAPGYDVHSGIHYGFYQTDGHQGYGSGQFTGLYYDQRSVMSGADSVGYLGTYYGLPDYGDWGAGYSNLQWEAAWRAGEMSRPHFPDWYHEYWYGNLTRPWYYLPVDTWANHFYHEQEPSVYCTPWIWGYWSYYNPYAVSYDQDLTVDYSKPLAMAGQVAAGRNCLNPCQQNAVAMMRFEQARDAFLNADYRAALELVDQAIRFRPDDRVMHEFRGLALFALERYQEAAGAIHVALTSGPGWDWGALRGMYMNTALYTAQLRTLERFVVYHPGAGDAFFLLGYHYLLGGSDAAAAAQFRVAARLTPADQLAVKLAEGIATIRMPHPEEEPVNLATLGTSWSPLGAWTARRLDGVRIRLDLMGDSKFTWTVDEGEHAEEFSGTFAIDDETLSLRQEKKPMLVGSIRPLSSGGFRFKLVGDNPGDHGLIFRQTPTPTCGGPIEPITKATTGAKKPVPKLVVHQKPVRTP